MREIIDNKKSKRSRRGFTLSELLISVGLMAFVATAAIAGLVVLARARETIDRLNKAEMIMIATVSYIRADLNNCNNPHPETMDCSLNSRSTSGAVWYTIGSERYNTIIIQDGSSNLCFAARTNSKVQYWNSTPDNPTKNTDQNWYIPVYGIWVKTSSDYSGVMGGFTKPVHNPRSYVIAQNVMAGTGMYSRIKDDIIKWNETEKYFELTVEVVDVKTDEVVLSQDVIVCPDPMMPTIP